MEVVRHWVPGCIVRKRRERNLLKEQSREGKNKQTKNGLDVSESE